jgi:hypothetical protein
MLRMNIVRSLTGVHARPCYACGAPQSPMSDTAGNPIQMTAHEFICLKGDPKKLPAFLRVEFQKTLNWEKQERRKRLEILR